MNKIVRICCILFFCISFTAAAQETDVPIKQPVIHNPAADGKGTIFYPTGKTPQEYFDDNFRCRT